MWICFNIGLKCHDHFLLVKIISYSRKLSELEIKSSMFSNILMRAGQDSVK